jgi:hypothetical protein
VVFGVFGKPNKIWFLGIGKNLAAFADAEQSKFD